MKIKIDELIKLITAEVITELEKKGVEIDYSSTSIDLINVSSNKIQIDMSKYKTPVLLEKHLSEVKLDKTEVVVPKGTILSPGARDIIRKRNLIISYN